MDLLALLVLKYPATASILSILSVIRIINKPLFSFLHTFVAATSWKADDALLEKIERSAAYKIGSYLLDWTLSVKLSDRVGK